jgi:hypothetical protein
VSKDLSQFTSIAQNAELGDKYREFAYVVNSSMVRRLRERQMLDSFFLAVVGKAADFSVPGAGKTATVLGVYAYLKHLGKVNKVIVVCPKNAFMSWESEWRATFGNKDPLRCFCLADPRIARMSKTMQQHTLELDTGNDNLLLLNYESLGKFVPQLKDLVPNHTLLVFDEVHRVKALGGKRARAALDVSFGSKFTIALTGTPIPNTYQDIYNLLHILYPDDYDTFFGFDPDELKDPDPNLADRVNESLKPFFCRTSKTELGVPAPEPDTILSVPATSSENRLLHILYSSCTNALALIVRTLQLESDPEMLTRAIDPEDLKYVLDQVGEDYTDLDFVDYSQEFPELVRESGPTSKLLRCEGLVKSLVQEGKPVIVWCIFIRSINNITDDLKASGIAAASIHGSTPQETREEILNDFRAGKYSVLVTNPQTLAESISLHKVCHDAVYFEYGYNLVHLLQSKDRIHRLGLSPDQKTRYYFMQSDFTRDGMPFSLDEKIYNRLKEKEQTMLEAIDGGYLEPGYLDSEDLRIIFGELLGDESSKLTY